ncbi:MAG: hypothetical protein JXB88_09585 [Spirochaetales bacterium]|nr:hypothetical protein [Spirochaetales bacterium]
MIEKYYNPLITMYDRLNTWKQFRKDIDTKLRLFYLECRQNLELLSILNLEPGNDEIHYDDQDYNTIIEQLTTVILEMIFLEGKKNKFYEVLRKVIDTEEDEEDTMDENISRKKKSLIQACVYLYVKITTLKKIAKIEKKGKALKKIYFRTRVNNIQNNLVNIVKALNQHKEIKEITSE